MALVPVPAGQVARTAATGAVGAGIIHGLGRITDYYQSVRRPLSSFLEEKYAGDDNPRPRQRPRPSSSNTSTVPLMPSFYSGRGAQRLKRSLRARGYGKSSYRRKRFGRFGRRKRNYRRTRGLFKRKRRFSRRFRKTRGSRKRKIASFYKRVIKCSVKRTSYTHTVGNEDAVYSLSGVLARPCLLTQPHDIGQSFAATTTLDVMNVPQRASQVVRYPMDYGSMEFMLGNYVATLGTTITADNQRFLVDCHATYRITSLCNVPFECDVIRWYLPKGLPYSTGIDTGNNTFNIINFLGFAAADYGVDVGNANATNQGLYNCECIDSIVSNRNRICKAFGLKIKKKRYLLHPGASVESKITIKERVFNIYPWWYSTNAGTTLASGANRVWFIPPGSRGILYLVRAGDAGTALPNNVNNTSYQSEGKMSYNMATFLTHYQVKYGLRHLPETPKGAVFLTDSGVQTNLRSGTQPAAVLEATDDVTTGSKSAV